MADRCPTCGVAVRIVGSTTQHYEPVADEALRLAYTALERAQPDAHDRQWYLNTVMPTVKAALGLNKRVAAGDASKEGRSKP